MPDHPETVSLRLAEAATEATGPWAAGLDCVLSALPHLTGDELRRVAEAMPRVAGEWAEVDGEWSRVIDNETVAVAQALDYGDLSGALWEAWTVGNEPTHHETPRAAQAACDARLEAAGVRLCGEVVRDGE